MPAPISPDNVLIDVDATTREDVLRVIAEHAHRAGYATDADGVLQGLVAREAELSTALMDEISIPHAKHASITSTALIMVRTAQPVDWQGEPTRVALGMLVPAAEAGTTHLTLLAQVSRALIDDDVRAILRTGDAEAVAAVLEGAVTL